MRVVGGVGGVDLEGGEGGGGAREREKDFR